LKWHDTLALLDVELIQKSGRNNVVPNALSRKEEFQVEKPLTKILALKTIFQGKNSLKHKIQEAYVKIYSLNVTFKNCMNNKR